MTLAGKELCTVKDFFKNENPELIKKVYTTKWINIINSSERKVSIIKVKQNIMDDLS